MNDSVSPPSSKITMPGLVQNCPVPISALVQNSPAISFNRSFNALGRMTTGLTLDNSR